MMPDRADRLRTLVAARSLADRDGIAVESVEHAEAATAPPGAGDVTARVEHSLARRVDDLPPDEVGDPRDYRRALDLLLRATGNVVRRLDNDPEASLTPDDIVALEAVVRSDGTRPTLLIRDGAADPDHPLAGDWAGALRATRDRLRDPIRAIGRIEPAGATARSFFGTGWLVDAGAGLVLTNLHVMEAIGKRLPHRLEPTEKGFRILDSLFIDFAGESGRARTDRYRVVEAIQSGVDGPKFARLDAAVLRIEPTTESNPSPPPAIPVAADLSGPRGELGSFCVVGFPAPPAYPGGVFEGVNWNWVNATLFGNRYGVKRLAPGVTHRPIGSFDDDPRRWVFGHDATTLGGNSGSPVLGWLDDTPAGFGLHFAGASTVTNVAHAVVAAAEQLRTLGVPVRE